ncbi:hypothetical protein GA0004734_00027280 [Rhizobium sp. 9140]|nr:hypothetical protein GA0004734_00027280 [Rhizobium sp. 9140]
MNETRLFAQTRAHRVLEAINRSRDKEQRNDLYSPSVIWHPAL